MKHDNNFYNEAPDEITYNHLAPARERAKTAGMSTTGIAVNSKYVRVRKSPSANAQVVTVIDCGSRATILERVDGFYKVRVDDGGYIGYIASNYFKED